MRPVLFDVFGWPIHSYGFMLAIAFLIAIFRVGKSSQKRLGIGMDTIIDMATWILVGAIVGSRFAYVITEYRFYLQAPLDIFNISSGGLAFHGGLIGGFLAGYWFLKYKKIAPWPLADIVVPYVALGYAIVRIGCLLNGCCYGKVSTVPWAMRCAANDLALRHPTQIYSMVGSLVLFGILFSLRNHRNFSGYLFLLYIGLYSILRYLVEFFRVGPMVFQWLSLAQMVCLVLAGFAFSLIGVLSRRYHQRRLSSDAGTEIQR